MTKNGIKTENRLSTLEANYKSLNDKVVEIAENHLVHLAEDLKNLDRRFSELDRKLAYYSGGIVVAIWIMEQFLK